VELGGNKLTLITNFEIIETLSHNDNDTMTMSSKEAVIANEIALLGDWKKQMSYFPSPASCGSCFVP